ncbi:MAG: tetratricopeptide repeat protein [Gemmatimonadetes bacterium]|nr:tetratricopeptide repeat protein [Gemmatimonadota bacterium]
MRRARWARRAWVALALSACSAGPDHETLGDRRYAEGAYLDALAEYRLAARQRHPSVELRGKLALAAVHAGALAEAVRTYREMALADAAAAEEAADGLTRAARLAVDARDPDALRKAVAALREIAPGRVLGALAGEATTPVEPGARSRDGADLVLMAAAAGGARATADSFLLVWGDLNARAGRCDVAERAYEAVLRRRPAVGLAGAARGGLAGCAVEEGRAALGLGNLAQAEEAFRRAIGPGAPDSTVRLAWLLIGDARWVGGDTAVALEAYGKAAAGGDEADPVVVRANEQMRKLLDARNPQP